VLKRIWRFGADERNWNDLRRDTGRRTLLSLFRTWRELITKNYIAGEWEHTLVSAIKGFIPDSAKRTWHDWRVSMKKTEHDIEGSNEISKHVEMAGWGVEEADKANKMDASTYPLVPSLYSLSFPNNQKPSEAQLQAS
jgi:hypothetical protein